MTLLLFVLLMTVLIPFGVQPTGKGREDNKLFSPPKHIVILLCDALRWDHVGAYGQKKCHTPNIDSLAKEGLLFKSAHTVCPISSPSYATIFTSQFPFEHGITNNAQSLSSVITCLPASLHDRGFHTAAFMSNYYCGSNYGFDRGFDTFKDLDEVGKHSWTVAEKLLPWLEGWNPKKQPMFLFVSYMDLHEPYSLPYEPRWLRVRMDGRVVRESACPELEETLWMQLSIPPGSHKLSFERVLPPLRPWWKPKYDFTPNLGSSLLKAGVEMEPAGDFKDRREDPRAKMLTWMFEEFPASVTLKNPTGKTISGELLIQITRRYDLEEVQTIYPRSVEFLDHEIGRVLDTLRNKGVLDETLIILLSDHGEGLGDHGLKMHIEQLYDSLMHVPLIMRYPPLGKEKVIDDVVSIIDLAPTISDMLGQPWSSRFGQSLFPMIRDGGHPERQWVFAETYPPEAGRRLTSLRTTTAKLIVNHTDKKIEYYDLVKDPSESKNIYSAASPEVLKAIETYCTLFNLTNPFDELSAAGKLNLDSLSPEEIQRLKSLGYIK